MEEDDIKITDWQRIAIGEVPPAFFLEVLIRTIVVYLILMLSFRLMGSRMSGRLNRIEQASLVTLAAAIGVPIQSPERGLLPAVIIAVVVVVCGIFIARWSSRNESFERKSQGKADLLIKDGIIRIHTLALVTLSRERVFAQLRTVQIVHLGQVQRFYLEANGSFTLVTMKEAKPGLSVIPGHDPGFRARFARSGTRVCSVCGNTQPAGDSCSNCSARQWEEAITL